MNWETNYNSELSILVNDIEGDRLTYIEARDRCNELWKHIPYDISLNPVALATIMKEKYSKDPNFDTFKRIFTIDISNIDEDAIDEYVKSITKKFKAKL